MELDMENTLSEQEKHKNYKMLMEALSEKNPTTEWIAKHGDFIIRTRAFFSSFNHVLIIATDPAEVEKLRENCRRCEVLLQNLINSIITAGTYDLVVYRLFAQNLEPLVRQYVSDDDLAEILGKMQM
jgi:hypothetical protein